MKFIQLILTIALIILGIQTAFDAANFNKIVDAKQTNCWSWYPPEWWKSPYTHYRVLTSDHKVYGTLDYTRNEVWIMCEAVIDGQPFWTILYRAPYDPKKLDRKIPS